MKTFLGFLIDMFVLLSTITLGLFLTGHLVIATKHIVKEVIVDVEGGLPFLQTQDEGTQSRIVFVK